MASIACHFASQYWVPKTIQLIHHAPIDRVGKSRQHELSCCQFIQVGGKMFWRKALQVLVISILLVGGFSSPSTAEGGKILSKTTIAKSTYTITGTMVIYVDVDSPGPYVMMVHPGKPPTSLFRMPWRQPAATRRYGSLKESIIRMKVAGSPMM